MKCASGTVGIIVPLAQHVLVLKQEAQGRKRADGNQFKFRTELR